jgi:ATP-dependent RNA helicase DDX21
LFVGLVSRFVLFPFVANFPLSSVSVFFSLHLPGKTLAFGLPSLMRLLEFTDATGKRIGGRMQRGRSVSMLVLCPTRELARQVQEELAEVARPVGLFVEVFHGGVSYGPQASALRQGVDVIVGTPGRIMDHMERGNLNLSECDIAVLDEADEVRALYVDA